MRLSIATPITFLWALGYQTVLASEAVVSEGGTPSIELCEDTADGGELACREWAWHGEWYVGDRRYDIDGCYTYMNQC